MGIPEVMGEDFVGTSEQGQLRDERPQSQAPENVFKPTVGQFLGKWAPIIIPIISVATIVLFGVIASSHNFNSRIESLSTGMGSRIDSVGTRVDSVGTRVDGVSARIDRVAVSVDQKIEDVELQMSDLNKEVSEIHEEIGELRTDAESLLKSLTYRPYDIQDFALSD